MKTIYPSKIFLNDVRAAISAHDVLEILIQRGWRTRILAREVQHWLPVAETSLMQIAQWRVPSIWCQWMMVSLHATHYMALSAEYEMHSTLEGESVILTYRPL